LKPSYVLGFDIACPDEYREEFKTQKNQVFGESTIGTTMLNELNRAKRLIMSAVADELETTCGPGVEILIHISG